MMTSGEIRLSGTMSRRMPVLAQSPTPQSQTAGDGLDEIVVTAQGAHSYSLNVPVCFCSQLDAFNAFRNFSAPGAPYAQDGRHVVYLPGLTSENPILQTVDPAAQTITNQTLPGHFFGGTVDISFGTADDGQTSVYINGYGIGPHSELNQIFGPAIFLGLAIAAGNSLNPDYPGWGLH
jgi:hypothetical protein